MRKLGILGSLVWDQIYRDPHMPPVEEWGGITYALGGIDAALPDDWEFVPLSKVGFDLAPRAREFVRDLDHVAPDGDPIEVPHPNNRVTLYYQSAERRCEIMGGGVPGWSWLGLKPLLKDLDFAALLADKAYSSRGTRELLRRKRIVTVIPQPGDQVAHRRRRGSAATALPPAGRNRGRCG